MEIDWEDLKDILEEHRENCSVCGVTNEVCAMGTYEEAIETLRQLVEDVPAAEDAYIIPAWKEWFKRRKEALGK